MGIHDGSISTIFLSQHDVSFLSIQYNKYNLTSLQQEQLSRAACKLKLGLGLGLGCIFSLWMYVWWDVWHLVMALWV